MAYERMEQGLVDPPFSHLLASQPPRAEAGTLPASALSVAMHGLVLFALLYATKATADRVLPPYQDVRVVELTQPLAPPPPSPPMSLDKRIERPERPKGYRVVDVPDVVPIEITPPTVPAVVQAVDYEGVGMRDGVGRGAPIGPGTADGYSIHPDDEPRLVPMTVVPRVLNEPAVIRALERAYPPMLRDAGIGGEVHVWFFIDEDGYVLRRLLDRSSGHELLDRAALEVAEIMKFSPALHRDRRVAVWVSIPIRFSSGR